MYLNYIKFPPEKCYKLVNFMQVCCKTTVFVILSVSEGSHIFSVRRKGILRLRLRMTSKGISQQSLCLYDGMQHLFYFLLNPVCQALEFNNHDQSLIINVLLGLCDHTDGLAVFFVYVQMRQHLRHRHLA